MSNKVLYCRLVELLAQYNLVMEFVPPDGHCLFHTFSFLESSRTMMEWREVLCNRIQQKADTCNNHQSWVSRANNLQPESRQCYADFNSWIMAMRQFEWGNSDFITEFCCELQAEVYCFLSTGDISLMRPAEVINCQRTYFIVNQVDDQGKHRKCAKCVQILYTFCTLTCCVVQDNPIISCLHVMGDNVRPC